MIRPVMPIVMTASARVKPAARLLLVDVILQTMACDVGREAAGALNGAGLPVDGDGHLAHVVAVAGGDGAGGDRESAVVGDPGVARVWIVGPGEGGGHEAGRVD